VSNPLIRPETERKRLEATDTRDHALDTNPATPFCVSRVRDATRLVIGLDSVPPLLAFERYRSVMPNLDRLMSTGCHGPLRSTTPPITVRRGRVC